MKLRWIYVYIYGNIEYRLRNYIYIYINKGYSYLSSLENRRRDWGGGTNHKEDMNQESNSSPCDIELQYRQKHWQLLLAGTYLVPCL